MSLADEVSSSSSAYADRLRAVLDVILQKTKAFGGAIWDVRKGPPELVCQTDLGDRRLDEAQFDWPGHAEKIQHVARARSSETVAAEFETHDGGTQSLELAFLPLSQGGTFQGVLELFFLAGRSPETTELERLVQSVLTTAVEEGRAASGASNDFAGWLSRVHASLELEAVALAIVNETKAWSRWDRVSLGVPRGARVAILAVSGLDGLDHRSGAVRRIARLMSEGLAGANVPTENGTDDDVRPARILALPLQRQNAGQAVPAGMLLCELFQNRADVRSEEDLRRLAPHAAVALEHALNWDRSRKGWMGRLGDSLAGRPARAWLLAALLLTVGIILLAVIPAPLVITSSGRLEPVRQRDIFAGETGFVEKLEVRHGDLVEAGTPLIQLRSPALEQERNRLSGEMQTVQQQIADLETLRGETNRLDRQSRSLDELIARIEELKVMRDGLRDQLNVVEERIASLTRVSPFLGTVLTWDPESLLAGRPVDRSDRLLTVADLNGEWQITLFVDQRDLAPVMNGAEWEEVRFVTADQPDQVRKARIRNLAQTMVPDENLQPTLHVVADVGQLESTSDLPGSIVVCELNCGTAPVGYVWFRRAIDRVVSWWALW